MKLNEIKQFVPNHPYFSIIDRLCIVLSPPFINIFLKMRLRPNSITLLMIIFGIVGCVCLSVPVLTIKWFGVICLFLWYMMDICDGAIARITKQFSKYGKEMDYMAHLITHPAFVISLWINFYELGYYNMTIYSIGCIIMASCELLFRNFISFDNYLGNTIENKNRKRPQIGTSFMGSIKYILSQLHLFPNIVVFFSIFVVIQFYFNINLLVLFVILVTFNCLLCFRTYLRRIVIFLR